MICDNNEVVMEFLSDLKDALSRGISKDEYMADWSRKMNINDPTKSNASEDVIADDAILDDAFLDDLIKGDVESAETTEKHSTNSLLMQIIKQQNKIQLQQDKMQQQLKDIQTSHEKEQQKMQHQNKMQDSLSWKMLQLETALVNLQQSFTENVRHCVHSESLDMQEKFSLLTETICSHMMDEFRNMSFGMTDEKSTFMVDKKRKISQTEKKVSEKNVVEATTVHDGKSSDNSSGGCSDHDVVTHNNDKCFDEEKEESTSVVGNETDSVKNVSKMSDTEILFKRTLRYELNAFLVNVQKLLLRPINSEDISFHFTDRIEKLFKQERTITTDQFLNVQTAVSSDIHARLCKMEIRFKQELERTGSFLKHWKQLELKVNKMLEEINNLKDILSTQLQTNTITSNMESAEMRRSEEIKGRKLIELEGNSGQTLTKPNQLESEVPCSNKYKPVNSNTDFSLQDVSSEKMQLIMLMLLMDMFMMLTCQELLDNKQIPITLKVYEPAEVKITSENAKRKDDKNENCSCNMAAPRNLTDTLVELMMGPYKEASFLCDLNYEKLTIEEDVYFTLKNIAPGYIVMLNAKILEKKGNLNFYIMSAVSKHDEKLTWPAEFSITITLVDKQPLAISRTGEWHTFTKIKSLYKPTKSTGKSKQIPLCYFRKDTINMFIHEGVLAFKASVGYVGDGKKDMSE